MHPCVRCWTQMHSVNILGYKGKPLHCFKGQPYLHFHAFYLLEIDLDFSQHEHHLLLLCLLLVIQQLLQPCWLYFLLFLLLSKRHLAQRSPCSNVTIAYTLHICVPQFSIASVILLSSDIILLPSATCCSHTLPLLLICSTDMLPLLWIHAVLVPFLCYWYMLFLYPPYATVSAVPTPPLCYS